jgi:TetR/AcrR family transcriptional regulator
MGTAERREREKNRRQNEILDAAEEVFFAKGLQQATMDDVAEKAELSKGTLYQYFKNKEALYLGISLRAMAVLRKYFERAVSSHQNAGDQLMAIGRSYIEFSFEYPYYFRTMSFTDFMQLETKEGESEDDLTRQCQQAGMGILELLAGVVEQGKRQNYFRPEIDPLKTAIVLWAAGNGVIQMTQNKGAHFQELHGFEKDFLLKEYLAFCERAVFINSPDHS